MGKYYSTKDFTNDNTIPLPVVMITDERLCNTFSYGEVILYSLIKYRMRLSAMNSVQYEDENGLFVIYSQKELADMLHKSERTVKRWFQNLKDAGWIKTVQTGVGECSRIYLRNVYTLIENAEDGVSKMSPTGVKNVPHGVSKMSPMGCQKCPPTYIENKDIRTNTENNTKNIKKVSVLERIKDFAGKNRELYDALMDWKSLRDKVKAPLTLMAVERQLKKLVALSRGDERVMIEVVNQSVDHGWKGFFSLKKDKQSKAAKVYERLGREENANGTIEEGISTVI